MLSEFVGGGISSVEYDEFQLRLIFEDKSEFVTQSPWRLMLTDNLAVGSGDIKDRGSEEVFGHLRGLKVDSVVISNCGDTQLLFENDRVLEVIADSARYETWEAHIEAGWVVFTGGNCTTLFPPSSVLPKAADYSSGTA